MSDSGYVMIDGIGKVYPDPQFFNLSEVDQVKAISSVIATAKKSQEVQAALPAQNAITSLAAGPVTQRLNQGYGDNVTAAASAGLENIKKGIAPQTIEQGATSLFPSAPIDIAKGAVQIATSPITAASRAYGGAVEAGTGGIIPADQAELSLMGLGGNIPSKLTGAKIAAEKEIIKALSRDQMTPQSALEAQAASPRPDQATLADVGGTNIKGLSERVAQTPGGARADAETFLTDRQKSQLSRVSGDLKDLTGTQKSAFSSIQDNIAKRTKDAAPAYETAYNAGDRTIVNDELRRLGGVPEVQTAMREAISGWQRSQIANGYGALKPGFEVSPTKTIEGVETGNFPTIEISGGRVPVTPNLQFWDYTKGALDNMIENSVTAEGTLTRRGRDLTIIKNKIVEQLDKEVPQYADARSSWGGPSSYISAIKRGQNFRSVSSEENSAIINGLNDAEKEAYRIGALSSLFTKMGNKPGELADITNELRSPEMRGKISALMPTAQAAAKWNQVLGFETNSSKLVGRSLAGSPTARRILESSDAGNLAGDLVIDAFMGSPAASLFKRFIVGAGKSVRNKFMSAKDEEVARILYDPNALRTLGRNGGGGLTP